MQTAEEFVAAGDDDFDSSTTLTRVVTAATVRARDNATRLAAKAEAFAEGFRCACAARYQSSAVTERELAAINPYTQPVLPTKGEKL